MSSPSMGTKQVRRNFLAGCVNGALLRLFFAMMEPSMVATWFVTSLTSSPVAVGLLMPIRNWGRLFPQLLVCGHVQRYERKMDYYRLTSIPRFVGWGVITACVFLLGTRYLHLQLPVFMVLFTIYCIIEGVVVVSFQDIVGKMIPPNMRGRYYGWHGLAGASFGLVGSAVAKYVLSDRVGLAFPNNFAVLFLIGWFALGAAILAFLAIDEPIEAVPRDRPSLSNQIAAVRHIMRDDPNFVLYVASRVGQWVTMLAHPFYTVYAKQELGATAAMAGTYLAAFTAAEMMTTVPWGWLADHISNRKTLIIATLFGLVTPALPLFLGRAFDTTTFALVFVAMGVAQGGTMVTAQPLLYDLAPASERVMYIGLSNTILGVVSMVSMLGGFIAQRWGLSAIFWVSAVCSVLSALQVYALRDARLRAGSAETAKIS